MISPAILAALLLAASPTPGATRNFGVSGFDRIRVDGPFKVRLTTGVAPYARATGSLAALQGVAIDVQGRTLVVRNDRRGAGSFGERGGPVEIAIGTHELSAAWLNGSGNLAIDRVKGMSFDVAVQGSGAISVASAAVDHLKVGIFGSGSASAGGTAGKLSAVIRGASSLDAEALIVKDATIGAEGSVSVKAHVTNAAKVDVQGTALVELTGRPACTVKALGSASVSGCR